MTSSRVEAGDLGDEGPRAGGEHELAVARCLTSRARAGARRTIDGRRRTIGAGGQGDLSAVGQIHIGPVHLVRAMPRAPHPIVGDGGLGTIEHHRAREAAPPELGREVGADRSGVDHDHGRLRTQQRIGLGGGGRDRVENLLVFRGGCSIRGSGLGQATAHQRCARARMSCAMAVHPPGRGGGVVYRGQD